MKSENRDLETSPEKIDSEKTDSSRPDLHAPDHDDFDQGGYCNNLVVDHDGTGTTCGWRSPGAILREDRKRALDAIGDDATDAYRDYLSRLSETILFGGGMIGFRVYCWTTTSRDEGTVLHVHGLASGRNPGRIKEMPFGEKPPK